MKDKMSKYEDQMNKCNKTEVTSLYRSPIPDWVPLLVSSFPFCLIGYLLGGHVMRLFHGHDEVLTIPGSDQSEEQQR